MRPSTLMILALLCALSGCVPKVTMTVETRDSTGNVIDRGDVTPFDSNSRQFRVNTNGTINLTISGQDSGGLQDLNFTGGFKCSQNGVDQQGSLAGRDANLPGQHPTSESFSSQIAVQCPGGTYTGSVHGCAKNAMGASSCTKDATF